MVINAELAGQNVKAVFHGQFDEGRIHLLLYVLEQRYRCASVSDEANIINQEVTPSIL